MNTRILKMAERDNAGGRVWRVPGYAHAFKSYHDTGWNALALSWPDIDHNGETVCRGARFGWHGRMAFRCIRSALTR